MNLYVAGPLLLMKPMNLNSIKHAAQTVRLEAHTKTGDGVAAQFAR